MAIAIKCDLPTKLKLAEPGSVQEWGQRSWS